jgi:hypothetical protein
MATPAEGIAKLFGLLTLPDWATTVRQSGDLFEIEINDEHPDFTF